MVTEKEAIDACGVYSVSSACDIQIQVHWPRIWEQDQQEKYMNHVYNPENPRFYACLLWANSKHSSKKRFQTKLFVGNHFTLVTNANFTLNRLKLDEGHENTEHVQPVPLENQNTSMRPNDKEDDWRGIPLENVGNTCYLNATLNCLLSVGCIRNGLDKMGDDHNPITKGKIVNELIFV